MPQRIQRRRTKGWRMPAGAVSVTRPGPWGNPFVVYREPVAGVWMVSVEGHSPVVSFEDKEIALRVAVMMFEGYALERRRREPTWLDPIRGKKLACYCGK